MPNNTPVQYPVCNCLYTCTHTCIVSQLSSIVSQFFCCCWFVTWQLTTSNNKRIEKGSITGDIYPVHICAAGLCIWSRQFVYMLIKKRLFGAIPLEHFWAFSATFSLSLNIPSGVCYVQQAVQTEQFMLFQIKHRSFLAIVFWAQQITPLG